MSRDALIEAIQLVTHRFIDSLPDLAAYPQFALYWAHGFHGATDIQEYPALMEWLARMRPYVSGEPALVPPAVRKRELP